MARTSRNKTLNIKEIHFRDLLGNILWTEKVQNGMFLAPGSRLVNGGAYFTVASSAVENSTLHVNLVEGYRYGTA